MADSGGASAPAPAFAAAALLALDVADRKSFEDYRKIILKDHTEAPMMWTFTSFLLDRYHGYWRFQVPFTAGWSYERRQGYFLTKGYSEAARRMLRTELRTLDGEPLRIPDNLDSQWTAIVFAKPGPWNKQREDGLPPSPDHLVKSITAFAASRSGGDVKVYLAMLGGDAATIRAGFEGKDPSCPVLIVPEGMDNPLIHRLGILSEDNQINSVLIRKDGSIALAGGGDTTLANVIEQDDEEFVSAALERGDIEAAKTRIFSLAPTGLRHLIARARVYMALKQWDKALADAEEVVQRQRGIDGGMSLRTAELDEAEQLRDSIVKLRDFK